MKPSPTDPVLAAVGDCRCRVEDANRELEQAVLAALAAGHSWELVSRELLTSKQAAWERFREARAAQLAGHRASSRT